MSSSALDSLPTPSTRRVAVRVTPDAERQIRGGHPWVFEGSITSPAADDAASGDLAVVFDKNRKFIAIGLYDPESVIRVRILHQGRPEPVDAAFFAAGLATAIARRGALAADARTTAYRLVHGENDGLGGLVVDRYGDRLVVELFSGAWFAHLRSIVEILTEQLAPEQIVLRLGRLVRAGRTHGLRDGQIIAGEPGGTAAAFLENGLLFEADLAHGQKTGHFLDQRDNRAQIRELSSEADVLDVFSCTGGFSVHAADGGARSVISIDQSAPALGLARLNMARNEAREGVAGCAHEVICGDAFDLMEALVAERRRYDVVVVDPPSFAQRREQVPGALRSYKRLADAASRLVVDGGLLMTASCSARVDESQLETIVDDALAAARRPVARRWVTGHGVDHPIGFVHGAYLKAIYTRLG